RKVENGLRLLGRAARPGRGPGHLCGGPPRTDGSRGRRGERSASFGAAILRHRAANPDGPGGGITERLGRRGGGVLRTPSAPVAWTDAWLTGPGGGGRKHVSHQIYGDEHTEKSSAKEHVSEDKGRCSSIGRATDL